MGGTEEGEQEAGLLTAKVGAKSKPSRKTTLNNGHNAVLNVA